MSTRKKQSLLAIGLFLALILIDQVIKIYVKTHFYLRESVEVTSWFYLSFIENNGMAGRQGEGTVLLYFFICRGGGEAGEAGPGELLVELVSKILNV